MQMQPHTSLGSACVDLHIHSDASDGSLTVSDIITRANEIGLAAISFTDHDTVDGTCEAVDLPLSSPPEILTGIEMSVEHPSGGMHILGYLFDPYAPCLKKTLSVLQDARVDRNLKIIKKLQECGVDICYEDVEAVSVRGQVGRPHFAQTLVNKKVTRTVEEAFGKYLKKGRPGHAPKYRIPCAEAVEVIRQAGGVPALAHPGSLGIYGEAALSALLTELKSFGLKAMEVYYPEHDARQQALYKKLALQCELAMTGGTDFHGANKPGIHLGVGKGNLRIPYEVVEGLKAIC